MEESRETSTNVQERSISENEFLPDEFYADEKFFRAIPARDPVMISESGKVASVVFKDSLGVSVDREWHRSIKDAVNELRARLAVIQGKTIEDYKVVSVKKSDCDEVKVYCEYSPETNNKYHSLIKKSSTEIQLTKSQARKLAKLAVIEDC